MKRNRFALPSMHFPNSLLQCSILNSILFSLASWVTTMLSPLLNMAFTMPMLVVSVLTVEYFAANFWYSFVVFSLLSDFSCDER